MSASDESWEYHLTPDGWVKGSTRLDFGNRTHVDAPPDRLLTATFNECVSSSFSPMERSADVEKHAADSVIANAITKFGNPTASAKSYRGWPEFLEGLQIS